MRVDPKTAVAIVAPTVRPPAQEADSSFAETLMDAIKEVNKSQQDSKKMGTDYMANQNNVELDELLIAMEKASVTMQLTYQVRNKALEAYQEIARMQV